MFRFKLNSGVHNEGGKSYKSGDEIDTKSDLRRFNTQGSVPRFALIGTVEAKPVEPQTEPDNEPTVDDERDNEPELPLSEMHVNTLGKLARNRGIDTEGLSTREDYIAAIEADA